jgi:hypothetical protein
MQRTLRALPCAAMRSASAYWYAGAVYCLPHAAIKVLDYFAITARMQRWLRETYESQTAVWSELEWIGGDDGTTCAEPPGDRAPDSG